jgi:hypothetical protein
MILKGLCTIGKEEDGSGKLCHGAEKFVHQARTHGAGNLGAWKSDERSLRQQKASFHWQQYSILLHYCI